jgi:general secretion pathway protein B
MSFILDALKKSENERQEQGSTEFSSVPTSSGNVGPTRWLWLLAALLVINFAVLIVVLLRPDPVAVSAPIAAATPTTTSVEPDSSSTGFEQQVAAAIDDLPTTTQPAQATAIERTEVSAEQQQPPPRSQPQPTRRSANVPTIDQLRLDGSLQLEELHLDIHVYSDLAADRFVFINMDKHREDSRIDAGPVVREITPDGVILEYQGRRFLLPRE